MQCIALDRQLQMNSLEAISDPQLLTLPNVDNGAVMRPISAINRHYAKFRKTRSLAWDAQNLQIIIKTRSLVVARIADSSHSTASQHTI